ncbi:hypothetical protein PHET_10962, partial [Paragonimus heterotremus]
YQREWRFHKKEQIWLTRIIGANFTTDSSSEQGDYYFWDPLKAQKSTHQMTILYSDLDDAPRAFRLSSGTLSAFVSIGLPAGTASGHHSIGPHSHSGSHSALQQQHLAAYQQHQQQYSHQQSLLTRQQLGTVASLSNVGSSPQQPSGQMMALQGVTSLTGNLGSPSAATLANLFNARQQQQHKQQLSPTTNYFQTSSSHARSASTAAGSSVTPSTSPAATTGVTSMAANTLVSTSPNNTSANSTSGSSNVVDLAIDSDATLSRMANCLSITDAGGVQPVFENARL